jgi:hypothetical protein
MQQCVWITSNHIAHGHFECHFNTGKTVELRVKDKSRETMRIIERLLKAFFLEGFLAPGNDGQVHEETLAQKNERMGPTLHLVELAGKQLERGDIDGMLESFEEAHTIEYGNALNSYKDGKALTPEDGVLEVCVDHAQRRVDGLACKRQGVTQLRARDFGAAVEQLESGLALFPDNGEIKLLLDEAARKKQAYQLRHIMIIIGNLDWLRFTYILRCRY